MSLEAARKQEIRWQILHLLDSDRPNLVSESLLRRSLQGIQASVDEIRMELQYLKQRDFVRLEARDGVISAALLATGVDYLEGNSASLPGLQKMESGLAPLELARRRELRWRMLRAVDINRPEPLPETLMQRVFHDTEFSLSQGELRRVASYLEQKGLLIVGRTQPCWNLELTADGVDVCEYAVNCPSGVGRPEKYWS